MRVLTAEQVAGNAYRVLGLPATASQADVEQAARRMRIWPDGKRIPPTAWDLPWVGPLTRSRGAIEQAVARLMDPESRVTERLAWFHAGVPAAGPDAGAEFDQAVDGLAGSDRPAEQHGAALARYVATSARDPDIADLERWRRCVESVQALAESGAFRDYLVELEAGGDYEKRAAIEEVTASLAALPGAAIAGLMGRAESALEDDKLEPALNVAKLLRSTDAAACGRLLDRVEDVVERRCVTADEELRRTVVFRDDMVASNEQACRQAQRYYEESIEPVVGALGTFAADEPHRAERVRWACARLLSTLGTAWIAARYFAAADRTFRAGKDLAKGSTLERRLAAQIEENAPRVRQYQASYHVMDVGQSAVVAPAGGSVVTAPTAAPGRQAVHRPRVEYARPRSFRMSNTPSRSSGGGAKSAFAGGTFLIFVVFGIIRAVVSGLGPSRPSPSYYVPPASSYHYTPPRTTPYTDPSSQDPYRALRELTRSYSPPARTPDAAVPTLPARPVEPSPTKGPQGQPSAPSTFFGNPNDLSLSPAYSTPRGGGSTNDRGRSQ